MYTIQTLLLVFLISCMTSVVIADPGKLLRRVSAAKEKTIIVVPTCAALLGVTVYSFVDPGSNIADRLLLGLGTLLATGCFIHCVG